MSNMYEFIGATWNPLAGECLHNCSYCYVKSLKIRNKVLNDKYSGEIRVDEKALNKIPKEDNIFVCSCNDLFAKNVSEDHINKILDKCSEYNKTFYFQTKYPRGLYETHSNENGWITVKRPNYPKNTILGVTLETNRHYPDIMNNCLFPLWRERYILDNIDFITIEPIMDFDLKSFLHMIQRHNPKQVNIGCDSKGNKLPEPPKGKILELIKELETFTKVHLKSNLNRLLK